MKTNFDIDLFCNVIDNYGDAGVAWRLARSMAIEKNLKVRLYINKPQVLASFEKEINADLLPKMVMERIEVRRWSDCLSENVSPIVIETFGCRLPEDFEKKLCSTKPTPLWINIEYLSAEDWVGGCHLLPSPHPKFGTPKYFFFPGFTDKTGGLIIEHSLFERQQRLLNSRKNFLMSFGCNPELFSILVFCYPTSPLSMFVDVLSKTIDNAQLLLCHGQASETIDHLLQRKEYRGIKAVKLPMVSQETFDNLMFLSDLLIVRGEDSFVRAQLAAKPFIWNIYPQENDVHLTKLGAFFKRILPFLGDAGNYLERANFDFNCSSQGLYQSWPELISATAELERKMLSWRKHLIENGSLIDKLCKFIDLKLK